MPADAPTILATSGGIQPGRRVQYEFSALTDYAVDLSGVTGRAPRVCMVPTAQGDNSTALRNLYDAAQVRGFTATHLALFPMPNVDDIEALLLGVSAGSICWHVGGTTDSFGPDLRPVTNGLALVPFSNGVHYDSEPQRRPFFQRLIADGTLPAGYATDDGAGVLYRGTEFVEAVSECDGAAAYFVDSDGARAVERRLDTRRL